MWFVFGFVTLISFSVYLGHKRYTAGWKGTPSILGLPYEYAYQHQKNDRIPSFMVAVKAPSEFDFVFKRESAYDRLCKFLGLSVEYQVGEAAFDKLVYIVSNDGHLMGELLTQDHVKERVLALFQLDMYQCAVTQIRCAQGRLWATVKVGKQFQHASDFKYLNKVQDRVAALLLPLGDLLQASRPPSQAKLRDPFIVRAAIVLACSTGLVANGLSHLLRIFWITDDFTIDVPQLWWYAAYGGGALVVLLVFLALVALGRSARTHLVLVELVLVGSIGAVTTVFAELRDLNAEADSSPVVLASSPVVGKTVSRSRKSGTHYYVQVSDWVEPTTLRKIKVSSDFYDQAQVGATMEFQQRAGFLGVRWVESYALVPKS